MSDGYDEAPRLRALLAAATPAPWSTYIGKVPDSANEVAKVRGVFVVGPRRAVPCGDEAAAIVALRNAAPALLAELDRLRAECLRLSHAEAEAMSVVLSQEGQIDRLRAELARVTGECGRLTGWLRHIEGSDYEGGDYPCDNAQQLRRWAYEAVTLARTPPA